MNETRAYTQYYVSDIANDGSEDPIDAIGSITFDSSESMASAMTHPSVAVAAEMREKVVRSKTIGIHSAVVERTVTLV